MATQQVVEAMKARMTQEEAEEVRQHAHARKSELGWRDPVEHPSSRKPEPAPEHKPDPYAKSALSTMPTRMGTYIKDAKSQQEVEDLFQACLEEQGLDWDKIPQPMQDKLNEVADKKIAALQK